MVTLAHSAITGRCYFYTGLTTGLRGMIQMVVYLREAPERQTA